MVKLSFDRKTLRAFGLTMGAVLLVISSVIFIRHRHNAMFVPAASALFFASALLYPPLLKPVYAIWMRFAFMLGWVNTRIILLLVFYLVFTPIGFIIRLLGNDLLKRKMEKEASSYWQDAQKTAFSRESYEKQF